MPVQGIGEVRLPDTFLTVEEVTTARKEGKTQDEASSVYWLPKDAAYQGEIDPPHIAPFNKSFEEIFPGMPNFRMDYDPVEMLRGRNLTAVLQKAETMDIAEAKQQFPAHFEHNEQPQLPAEHFKGRKLTPEEIEEMESHIEEEQARIARTRTEK